MSNNNIINEINYNSNNIIIIRAHINIIKTNILFNKNGQNIDDEPNEPPSVFGDLGEGAW